MNDCVLLRELPTACGRRFGHATLNAPAALNALSLQMIDRIAPQLGAWAEDPGIVGVVLDGAGDRAFCAGGDVRALYAAIRAARAEGRRDAPMVVKAFFEREYRLDYRIHTYPKPVLCWGHGVVMGGGVGLMVGASHRVVTPQTRMAMPEISIGLYPDVGGSWFLNRMPGRTGLFLALTGAQINAADARFAGLGDFVLRDEDKATVLSALAHTRWHAEHEANRSRLSHLLGELECRDRLQASALRGQFDCIEEVIGHGSLGDIVPRLRALAQDADPWLRAAGTTFDHGAPSSAVLSHAMLRRARHCSLADVLRLEFQVSVAAVMAADFSEGVRALLVDKDRNPRWQHASPDEVAPAEIEALFAPDFDGPHPLADLS
ncbi:enoyl-CoA hydratase/isomerase family protein [Azoarcus sp. L1K30]|uniref:enoyl-CoA hydratase/isomerase family protein n=1 Tax=Azoarcus sp. L1K30 TaxID=2820277 RepID=UPI001B83FC39|nr:enoyl-CoA hydratase/isomerase family protein [Azoarcus sp. L1K30]MBR0566742.1 enoyl-CoA hydratase/isomerase family protein [Azoarcus sp. L1K30]